MLTSTLPMARVNCNAIMLIGGLARQAETISSAQVTGEIRGMDFAASGGAPLARVQCVFDCWRLTLHDIPDRPFNDEGAVT